MKRIHKTEMACTASPVSGFVRRKPIPQKEETKPQIEGGFKRKTPKKSETELLYTEYYTLYLARKLRPRDEKGNPLSAETAYKEALENPMSLKEITEWWKNYKNSRRYKE